MIDAIGVFDSGVGGLTVVSALRRRLPGESILYLGDTARLPYGSKSPDTVTRYTRRNIEFLTGRGVKARGGGLQHGLGAGAAQPRHARSVPTSGG